MDAAAAKGPSSDSRITAALTNNIARTTTEIWNAKHDSQELAKRGT